MTTTMAGPKTGCNVQDYNGTDAIAGRAQLLFKPCDDLEILLSGNYSRNSAAVGAWQHQSTKPSADGNTSLPLPADERFLGLLPGLRRLRLCRHRR
jgi:hypothetical protein